MATYHSTIRVGKTSSDQNSMSVFAGRLANPASFYQAIYITNLTTGQVSPDLSSSPSLSDDAYSGTYRTLNWNNAGLDCGTTYYYRIDVYTTTGGQFYNDSYAHATSVCALPDPNPDTPTLQLVSVNGLTATYKVITGNYTVGVDIDYRWVSGVYNRSITIGSNTSGNFTVTVPNYDTSYSMDAQARNSNGDTSAWSNVLSFTSDPAPIVVGTPVVTLSDFKNNAITVNWTSASNAWYYQVQYRLSPSGIWYDAATSQNDNSHEVSGLEPVTDYQFRVRGYQGSSYGSWSTVVTGRTQTNAPTAFGWTYPKVTVGDFNLTANEWNALAAKINQWRTYKNLSSYPFSTAAFNAVFFASIFNEARTAISPMSPLTTLPAARSSGNDVTATALNGLRDSLNSITI